MMYRATQLVLLAAAAFGLSIMVAALAIPPLSDTDFLAIAAALG